MKKQQIGWKRERDSAREQGRERERERKEQIRSQELKLAGVNVASVASRISCRRRRPPAPSNTSHQLLTGSRPHSFLVWSASVMGSVPNSSLANHSG
jgi:hypothetical protein